MIFEGTNVHDAERRESVSQRGGLNKWLTSVKLYYSSNGLKRQEWKLMSVPISASVLATHVSDWSNLRDYIVHGNPRCSFS